MNTKYFVSLQVDFLSGFEEQERIAIPSKGKDL